MWSNTSPALHWRIDVCAGGKLKLVKGFLVGPVSKQYKALSLLGTTVHGIWHGFLQKFDD